MIQISTSKLLSIFAIYLTVVACERCKFRVPFSSKLVGRSFFSSDGCYRPTASTKISIFPKSIVYEPFIGIRFFTEDCDERFVFHIRQGDQQPFIIYFPNLPVPDGSRLSSASDKKPFCDVEHPKVREKYFPTGDTRVMFKRALKRMVKGALGIRDFGCVESDEGFVQQSEGRSFMNVDLDGVVTYFLSVGYQYNFCAEP